MFQNALKAVLNAAYSANLEWIGDTLYSSNHALMTRIAPLMMRGTPYEIVEVSGIERMALSALDGVVMYAIRTQDTPPAMTSEIDPTLNVQGFISEEYFETADGRIVALLRSPEGDTLLGVSGADLDKFNRASCQGEAKVDAIRRFLK